MKNIPNKIYLQIEDDSDYEGDFKKLDLQEMTWSSERINKSDIVFYRRKGKR